MTKILLLLLTASLLIAGEIRVALAANVSYAMDSLIRAFNETYPSTKVKVVVGSSGKLTAQIRNGASYDIFISANMKYPKALYRDKIAITKPVVYAHGTLVMLSSKKIDITKRLDILRDKSVKKIAIANPKSAPYGEATMQLLINSRLFDDLESKIVYAESISHTLSYVINATDIGFIAKSALFSPNLTHLKKDIEYMELDRSLYMPIKQGIVMLKNGAKSEEVELFYNFMLSKEAKKILKSFGYMIPVGVKRVEK
jgi:molybdate transport system substrate-binding protein